MLILEFLKKVNDGLVFCGLVPYKININHSDDGGIFCQLYINDFKRFNRDAFCYGSCIEKEHVHKPELVRYQEGSEFVDNHQYITIKIKV